MSLVWSLLPNALLPVPLRDIEPFLERFLVHLLRPNVKGWPRQLERLRQQLLSQFG
jgi:hypothetical protein